MIERRPKSTSPVDNSESLVELLRLRGQHQRDRVAYQYLVDGQTAGVSLTYGQLDGASQWLATHLSSTGKPGSRALLLYPPGPEFLVAFFGCLRAGIIAVPLPPPDAARVKRALPRLESVILDAQATLVLTTSKIETLVRDHLSKATGFQNLAWIDTESVIAERQDDDANDAANSDPEGQSRLAEPGVDDIALLQYTSGSTSTPKGVMVSHGNVLRQCQALKLAAGYNEKSVTCTWMPYHHDYGLIEGLLLPLYVGARCYFLSPLAFIKRPYRWLQAISNFRVTHSQAPNFAYDLCAEKVTPGQKAHLDLSCWTVATTGAEPVRPQTIHAFHEAFKACGLRWRSLAVAYGLAEATLVVTHSTPGEGPTLIPADVASYSRGKLMDARDHIVGDRNGSQPIHHGRPGDEPPTRNSGMWSVASCGLPLTDTEVAIVDPKSSQRVPEGNVGEIWVAGPSVTQGYWNRPQETRNIFQAYLADTGEGPYLRTGDLGCLREGQLYVTGREKDLIIIRGLNHYPQDIEQTVEACHSALRVAGGAAFSVESRGEEELVVVYEVQRKRLREIDPSRVMAAIREAIFYEHDLHVHAIALLEPGGVSKTTSGKIQRRAMKTAFLADDLNVVARWTADRKNDSVLGTAEPAEDSASESDRDASQPNHDAGAEPAATRHRLNPPAFDSVVRFLCNWFVEATGHSAASVDPAAKFSDLGLDSLRAADLAAELEGWIGQRVEPTIFWRFASIDALAGHFSQLADPLSGESSFEVSKPVRMGNDAIAIVGMGCRFPGGCDTPEAFWRRLREGVNCISEVPPQRWSLDEYYDDDPQAPGKMYSRHGGFVDHADSFDAPFFGMAPREAECLDPQQRLLLEVVWESLENAGLAPHRLRGSETGVFVGLSSDDHDERQMHGNSFTEIDAHRTLGAARSMAAGRIAYGLGLHGPAIQLDTACSSSLVAVCQACQSLLAEECDLAIAGGVNLMLSPATTIALCKLTALSSDGLCKPFDAAADGYVRGEGCGVVTLKRLSDAKRDGDTILGTIRAAAVNHDGASNGLIAPNQQAQEQLLRKALDKARLNGCEIDYLEAHGPGTALGDPIELTAVDAVYNRDRPLNRPLLVGSAKANIGHLEAAAGIAGLIKVVLMLQHKEIPPQLNFHTPNPHIEWERSALRVPTKREPWPRGNDRYLAAVSSFGFSGTNAHVVIEAPTKATVVHKPSLPGPKSSDVQPPLHLFPLSANSGDSLRALVQKYVRHIEVHAEHSLQDLCFSAATGRDHLKHRLSIVASSRDELLAALQGYLAGKETEVAIYQDSPGHDLSAEKIAFLFTGQGTQYVGMGWELYQSQPVFRTAIERCQELLHPQLDVPLVELLFQPNTSEVDTSPKLSALDQTAYLQPALFSLQYALLELWKSWGIIPAAVIGHSSGEFAAAHAAGVMDLETGLKLITSRGRLMDSLPAVGSMAVVMADEVRVQAAIKPHSDRVSIAAVNGPEIVVISGWDEPIRQLVSRWKREGVDAEMLNTSNAGHSALMDPILEPLAQVADEFALASPQIDLVSNVSGELAGNEVTRGNYWADHARRPVRFSDGMQTLAGTGCRIFVEIGPNPNLLAMGMGCIKRLRPRPLWLPSLTKDRSGWDSMLSSLAALYVAGADIHWTEFHRPYDRNRVTLPTYAFSRSVYAFQKINSDGEGTDLAPPSPDRPSALPAPSQVASSLDHYQVGLEDRATALTQQLDEAAAGYVIRAIEELGIPWTVGSSFSSQQIDAQLPVASHPKIARVLHRLVERGMLEKEDDAFRIKNPPPEKDAETILDQLQQQAAYPECGLTRRAGSALASIWKGRVEPLSILFPDGETEQAIDFYRHSQLLVNYNKLAGETLQQLIARLPQNETLRVLEVGAGTGALTSFLLPKLPPDRSEYLFTDLSPLFLRAAERRFGEHSCLRTRILNIAIPGEQQGVPANSQDLVVAANVLHATPHLKDTLRNIRRLLKPSGWLMLLEAANPPFWGDIVFTLIDGWWNFEDTSLRPDYPLMRRDRWQKLLAESGFDDIVCFSDAKRKDESVNHLYLARSDAFQPASPARSTKRRAVDQSIAMQPPSDPNLAGVARELESPARSVDTTTDAMGLAETVRRDAARVMRLSPDEIELTQPLSELGLDSLMATELRARLGQSFGRELFLNTLQMRRSVQEIAAYLLEDSPAHATQDSVANDTAFPDLDVNVPRANLVPLQIGNAQTPLFFVPAGYGDLFAFQQIAYAIGVNQPVYGLQPAAANRVKTFRQMSIYRLASAYIAEIIKVQPEGPYFLSGYSAGGILAIELARELKRQGREVGLLVIFDPPSHVPFWLDALYRFNYRVCVTTRLLSVVGRIRSKFVRRLFHAVLDEGLRTHTSVTRGHRAAPYPGRITHFRARLSQSSLVSMKPVGWFWRRHALEGTEVHWIPGTHYGMLRGSGASVVVDELRDCLQRAMAIHPSISEQPPTNRPPRSNQTP